MGQLAGVDVKATVALRKESVDRNNAMQVEIVKMYAVALRKESVDRNCRNNLTERLHWVALRKESVDRNFSAGGIETLS